MGWYSVLPSCISSMSSSEQHFIGWDADVEAIIREAGPDDLRKADRNEARDLLRIMSTPGCILDTAQLCTKLYPKIAKRGVGSCTTI